MNNQPIAIELTQRGGQQRGGLQSEQPACGEGAGVAAVQQVQAGALRHELHPVHQLSASRGI